MRLANHLTRDEWIFAVIISTVHGIQHLFLRLVPPLIPILVVDLEAPLWQLGLLVTLHMLAGGLFQAPMGVLSDRIDRLYLLVPAIGLMSTGYLVFALGSWIGQSLPSLVVQGYTFTGVYQIMAVGIFIAGLGYGVIHPVGYPLISANVSPDHKGTVLGMWGSASKFGDAAAPILVGVLILVWRWEWVIAGIGLFGVVYALALVVAFRSGSYDTLPPAATDSSDPIDSTDAWRSDPRIFWLPMGVILVFYLFIMFTTNGLVTYTPVFISDIYTYSFSIVTVELGPESVANFYLAVLLISGALSQLVVGAIADVFDHRSVLVGLLVAAAAATFVLAFVTISPVMLFVVFVIIGSCIFGVNPVRDGLMTDITPAAYEGRTFGYFWTVILLVSAIYPTVIGYLGDTIGLRASFVYLGVTAILGAASIGLLYSTRIFVERPSASTADGD